MLQINNRDPRPIYRQLIEGLQRLMISGALAPDEKLPSVRELSGSLAINPNTIQRAYRELEAGGFVYTVPGKGVFVAGAKEAHDSYRQSLYQSLDSVARELFALGETPELIAGRLAALYGKE